MQDTFYNSLIDLIRITNQHHLGFSKKENLNPLYIEKEICYNLKNLYIPPNNKRDQFYLVTGEKIDKRQLVNDIIRMESCRSLLLINAKSKDSETLLQKERFRVFSKDYATDLIEGDYSFATLSFMHLLATGFSENHNQRIVNFLGKLKKLRDNKGQWINLPFYYILSLLLELNLSEAIEEILYILPYYERFRRKLSKKDKFYEIKSYLLSRVRLYDPGIMPFYLEAFVG